MRIPPIALAALLALASLSLVMSADARAAEWNLVFADDFERADPGTDWSVFRGELTVVDGRLKLMGSGATALVTRSFAPDVRITFEAEANPDAPPCDLSSTVSGSPETGYTYLFGFGSGNNRLNQLRGPGISLYDMNPSVLVEPGRRYHITATREGRWLSLEVDGVRILDGTPVEMAGGPGFDRVGLVTWNGMLVDQFRVYERAEPHPETPAYLTHLPPLPLVREGRDVRLREGESEGALAEGLAALGDGRFGEARQAFESVADPVLRLSGILHLLCDPRYEETRDDFALFTEAWAAEARAHPDNDTLQGFLPALAVFRVMVHERARLREAAMLMNIGERENPFYVKAKMLRGRIQYMHSKEGGHAAMRRNARRWLAELLETWPEVTLLSEYAGAPVPWGEAHLADTAAHPAWAALLREAYARQAAIIETWIDRRQQPDGQLGGGWGDDVEILRSWAPVAAISTGAARAREGITRLAEGVWEHATADGFEHGIGDVEHSAEPSADAFPAMLLLHPGDPRYVEWNLRSAKTITGFFGRDRLGYRRLMSNEVGAGGIRLEWQAGGDTPYTGRMMKHFIWLAEFGNTEARAFYLDWADGWRHWTMAELPDKPAGVAPETIWFPTGTITPPDGRPWYSRESNYYGSWDNTPGMVFDALLTAFHLSGDAKFLEPMEAALRFPITTTASLWEVEPGSPEWISSRVHQQLQPERRGVYHYFKSAWPLDSSPWDDPGRARNQLDGQFREIEQQVDRLLNALRHNLRYQTTEVMSTDRAGLPGAQVTWGAYTGALVGTRDALCPTWHVTYETPGTDFAALVNYATPRQLRVTVHDFGSEPREIGLRLWRLEPGHYTLRRGILRNEGFDWLPERRVIIMQPGARVGLDLPPGETVLVDFMQETALPHPGDRADLAVHPRDLKWDGETVGIVVHNIGAKDTGPVTIALERATDEGWETVETLQVENLPAPVAFTPSPRSVRFARPEAAPGERLRVMADPGDRVPERWEENNVVEFVLTD